MAEIGGTDVSMLANGFALEVADFQRTNRKAVIDRSNATTLGEPRNATGQRTGQITASGPRSTTTALIAKGIVAGALVTFRVRATPNLYIEVQARISEETMTNGHTKGSDWSITAEEYGAATYVGGL